MAATATVPLPVGGTSRPSRAHAPPARTQPSSVRHGQLAYFHPDRHAISTKLTARSPTAPDPTGVVYICTHVHPRPDAQTTTTTTTTLPEELADGP
uniref:Uncharacterized protein n=1 Tax=Aegilops tauschii subsp. strangulata TaxID=200361 RepID=A0A453PMC1_AEGTS